MATTKLYLDSRRRSETAHVLRINICHKSRTASINTGVKLAPNQWDATLRQVQNHHLAKYWNNFIAKRKVRIDTLLLKLEDENPVQLARMNVVELRDYLMERLDPLKSEEQKARIAEQEQERASQRSFLTWYDKFLERKSDRTKEIYQATRKRLVQWLGEAQLRKISFEDIKVSWLEDFEAFCAESATANSIAIHMRNIRAVVNYAIDNDITNNYAFRRFKIKTKTTRKRNFDVATLRRIFNHECSEKWQQKYLDFFKLSFLLIGINVVDLCNAPKIKAGRVEYVRAKTHRPYTIKVEDEALSLIDKYAGENHLVNFAEATSNYRHFYNTLSHSLNIIKHQLMLDEFTTYWARHSWATIAHRLGIRKEVIAQALGHGSHDVTDIYIEYDTTEVDIANRRVLDYVLYGIDYRLSSKG